MEHRKILTLLNEASDFKCVTRKWNTGKDQSNASYDVGNEIIYKTEVLKSNLCVYNDAYIIVTGAITVVSDPTTQVALKTCAPSIDCIANIDGTIYDAEDLVWPWLCRTQFELFWHVR